MSDRFISYAQNHEDVVLFRALGGHGPGFYIDVGAGDPVADSVTKAFYDRGWSGVNVEPHRASHAALAAQRPRDINLPVGVAEQPGRLLFHESSSFPGASTFSSMSGPLANDPSLETREVEVTTLAEICGTYVHCTIDFLKIDVEGLEREVIVGADFDRWRPRVVVVEATVPHSATASHSSWEPLLLAHGYFLALFDGLNRFYVREEDRGLSERLGVPANVHDDFVSWDHARALEEYARLEAHAISLDSARQGAEEAAAEASAYARELEAHARNVEAHARNVEAHARNVEAHARDVEARAGEIEARIREAERRVHEAEANARRREAHSHQVEEHVRRLDDELEAAGAREQVLRAVVEHRVPSIVAVVVHHRGAVMLERCLRSLLASEWVDLKIVLVANGAEEALPDIALEEPAIHVVETKALGFAAANNLGVATARSHIGEPEYYFFFNNDAIVEPLCLRHLADGLDSWPKAGIAGPRLLIWGAADRINSLGLNVTDHGEAWDEGIGLTLADYGTLPQRGSPLAVTGAALLIRAAALAEVGGWSQLYGYYFEDIDLCLKARARGWGVVFDPRALAHHAISFSSDRLPGFKQQLSWRNQIVLMLVHWPLGLWVRSGPRFVASQLAVFLRRLRNGHSDQARLQAGAWLGALRLAPRALRERLRWRGGRRDWTSLLRRRGSVPEIRLPRVEPAPWLSPQETTPAAEPTGDRHRQRHFE